MSFVPLLPGTGGANLGTDQVLGTPNIDFQVVKIGFASAGVTPVLVDATHGLPVNLVNGGVPAISDGGTFAIGSQNGLPMMGLYKDAAAALADGEPAAMRITEFRQLLVGTQAVLNGGANGSDPLVCTNTNNLTTIKSSAGQVYGIQCFNNGSALAYLKMFDAASVTMGTTEPIKNIPIPFNTNGAGVVVPFPCGLEFNNKIIIAVTAGEANKDNTALGATPHVIVNLDIQ